MSKVGGDILNKIVTLVFYFLILFIIYGCQEIEQTESSIENHTYLFDDVSDAIGDMLPLHFNQDIVLPEFDDVKLIWKIDGVTIKDVLHYEPPFVDTLTEIQVDITIDNMTKTFTYPITILAPDSALNQNIMHIYVDVPIEQVTKTTYRNAAVFVQSQINNNKETVFENNRVEIRGRGNSTWGMPKKPYRLRFADEVSILGMPQARNYVLLAEYADKSLLRNIIAYKFSSMLDHIEYAVSSRVVEVYFNEEYHGVYVLTEQIEIHENKLYVESIPGVVVTGYFLELDQRFYEQGNVIGVDGISVSNIPYIIKEPSPKSELTQEQILFINNYILSMEEALIEKEGYEQYIDVDNFIDYFIVQELFKNVDVGFGSVYFYKRPNDVIRMGPIWDFDLAIGNADYIDYGPYNWYGMRNYKNRWFKLMMNVPEIRERFKERYIEIYHEKIPLLLDALEKLGEAMSIPARRNFIHWDILGKYDWPNPPEVVNARTYQEQVNYVYDYIAQRSLWIKTVVQSQEFQNGIFD